MAAKNIEFTVNGHPVSVEPLEGEMLADLLRERLHFTGVKIGCNENECGACTVVIDGEPVGAIMRVSDTLAHNIHQGGTGIPSEIDDEMRSIAAAAARATGVDYGGVDLLRYHDSYCVLEVNGTPNWHCMAAPIPALLARYLLEKERDLKA